MQYPNSSLAIGFTLATASVGLAACSSSSAAATDPATDAGAETASETAADGAASKPELQASTDSIDGKTLAEQSALWWKWMLAIPKSTNPIEGHDCTVNQAGNVWYLAGTVTGKPTARSCAIPAGKTLFFPLVNSMCSPCPESGCTTPSTKAELTTCATAPATGLSLTIDGVSFTGLNAYHVSSDVFTFTAPANASEQEVACTGPIAANSCGIPTGDRFGVSDGYWIAVKPLAAGPHTLHFTGTYASPPPPFTEDLTFTLTVQ